MEAYDSTDPAEPADPIGDIDPAEPMEPIEPTDPTEPIDRIEPSLAIERIESRDPSDQCELMARTLNVVAIPLGPGRPAAPLTYAPYSRAWPFSLSYSSCPITPESSSRLLCSIWAAALRL